MNFHVSELPIPFVAAPMAGGISTPGLVAATGQAGGLGFLAAGYQTVTSLRTQIHATRNLVDQFGVNLFVPERVPSSPTAVLAYRARLLALADELNVELPLPHDDEDAWTEKITLLLDEPVPVVSFTFGCPTSDLADKFRAAGTSVIVTVTSADDAAEASASGADLLVVQGPEAGGHRATFRSASTPPTESLRDLVALVRSRTYTPIIAAGGLTTPAAVADALQWSAAVQVGTGLLDTAEAGTSSAYRAGLRDPELAETVVTRAFSGRPARGLRNHFIDEFGAFAPAAYPEVNQITAPLRRAAAAAGRYDCMSLWAGSSWRSMPSGATREVIDALLGSV